MSDRSDNCSFRFLTLHLLKCHLLFCYFVWALKIPGARYGKDNTSFLVFVIVVGPLYNLFYFSTLQLRITGQSPAKYASWELQLLTENNHTDAFTRRTLLPIIWEGPGIVNFFCCLIRFVIFLNYSDLHKLLLSNPLK